MDTQLIALLMFLPLIYLLFRKPASAASRRYPTELNFQVGQPVYLKSETRRKKTVSSPSQSGVNRSFLRSIALGSALVLLSDTIAMAQAPTETRVQLAVADNVSKVGKEDKRAGGRANDRAKDGKDNAELTEEMPQMRQLIEGPEARVNQL